MHKISSDNYAYPEQYNMYYFHSYLNNVMILKAFQISESGLNV